MNSRNPRHIILTLSVGLVVVATITGICFFVKTRGSASERQGVVAKLDSKVDVGLDSVNEAQNTYSTESNIGDSGGLGLLDNLQSIFDELETNFEGSELTRRRLDAARDALARTPLGEADQLPGIYEFLLSKISEESMLGLIGDLSRAAAARRDMESLKWVGELHGTAIDIETTKAIGFSVAELEGRRAFELLSLIKDDAVKTAYLGGCLMKNIDFGGVEAGFRLLEDHGITGGNLATLRAEMVARSLSLEGGGEILEFLSGKPPEESKPLLKVAMSAWASRSPSDAVSYVESIADPQRQGELVPTLIDAWGENDLEAASKWLVEHPAISGWDQSARSIARKLQENSPAESLAWTASIRNENDRLRLARETYQTWSRRDPERALASLQQYLSSEEVEILIKP